MTSVFKGFLGSSILLLFCVLAFSTSSNAQERGRYWHGNGNINKRQERQQDRIAQGVRDGQLTAHETARLESREARINREEARFRASGNGLSPRERATLERQLNRESRDIYRQKHDRQHQ